MLVLSRHIGERIFIGDDITICVIDIRNGNKVRIGVDAPRSVPVMREELVPERGKAEKPPAA